MSEDILQWVGSRHQEALRLVRLWGLAAGLVLIGFAAWLAWREAGLAGLPEETQTMVLQAQKADAFMRLQALSEAAHLAKIRKNSLLVDIIGPDHGSSTYPSEKGSVLPDDHPLRAGSEQAIARMWEAAFGVHAPPLPAELLRDPWGSPYAIEDSEKVCAAMPEWCPEDSIRSPGPDGVINTPDDILVPVPRHVYRHLAPK